jgi:AraC-like DNA-binding protein
MNELEHLYIPQLQLLKPASFTRDETRCYASFDGTVCTGDFVAVKADKGCLITRSRIQLITDLELPENHLRSLCIMRHMPGYTYGVPKDRLDPEAPKDGKISVFIQPNVGRTALFRRGEPTEVTRITYLPSYFDTIDLPFVGNFEKMAAVIPGLDDDLLALHLRGLLEELDFSAAQKPSGTYYYRSKALEALCHVMDMVASSGNLNSQGNTPDNLRFVRQVMDVVDSSISDVPSIRELSERFYVGHTYLCETFKSVTGMTIGTYVRKRRLELAKSLLRKHDLSVKQVARRVGFETMGGFAASFKQSEGMTPRQYRLLNAMPERVVLPQRD